MIRWVYAFIDRPVDRFDQGCDFWATVTATHLSSRRGEFGEFTTLLSDGADSCVKMQAVGDEGGVHLDLAVDDAAAFVETAVQAGAASVSEQPDWVVMRSPGGQAFCVVPWDGESVRPSTVAGPDGAHGRLDQVCVDVAPAAYEAEVAFWAGLTGWDSQSAALPEFHRVVPPAALPIRILLQRLGTDRPTAAHIDFACSDVEAMRAWHESCGARFVDRRPQWTVMRDPGGRTYCLTARDPRTG